MSSSSMPASSKVSTSSPTPELGDPARLERADDHRALPADLRVEERIRHRQRHLVAQLGRPDRVRDDQDVGHRPDPSPPRASELGTLAGVAGADDAAVTPGCSSTQATAWRRSVRPARRRHARALRSPQNALRAARNGGNRPARASRSRSRRRETRWPAAPSRVGRSRVGGRRRARRGTWSLEQAQRLLTRRGTGATTCARSTSSAGWFESPVQRIFPSSRSRCSSPHDSSIGVERSRSWIWSRSTWSRPSRGGSPRDRRGSHSAGCPSARPAPRREPCRTW